MTEEEAAREDQENRIEAIAALLEDAYSIVVTEAEIAEFLADVRHVCRNREIDFDSAVNFSRGIFEIERDQAN